MNLEHLAILKQGVEHWYKWRSEHLDITPDLECADLGGMNLTGANLGPAGYHFEYTAQMYPPGCLQVKSSFTAFQETSPSNLGFANLMYTNLTNADLRRANLRGTNLCLSMLAGAVIGSSSS
jgi:uncharacterized protein YjbI with pentapeptide repeats